MAASDKDAERSLTIAGRDEVEDVAESLATLKLRFDVIASSPLKRALETAQIAAKALKKQKALEVWEELKPEEDFKALYVRLAKVRHDASVLLVGHEPYLSTMIADIIGGGSRTRISLKKAGVAKLDVTSFAPTASGELRWLLTPRLIKKVS